jgi:hypothetical protein
MIRILRAFAWMRWRALINSFERTNARDTIERFSLAIDRIGPIVAIVLLVPSMLGVAALSAVGGHVLAGDSALRPIVSKGLRFFTFGLTLLSILGPIVYPVMERTNPVRLLLLPIPRRTLYAAQVTGSLADPWTLVALPLVFFLPIGLAAGGAFQSATVSMVAGLLFLGVLVGLTTLTGCVVQLVMRDRRRGELAALALLLLIPLAGVSMNVFDKSASRRDRHRPAPVERPAATGVTGRIAGVVLSVTPSEQYALITRATPSNGAAFFVGALLLLGASLALLHGSAFLVFERLLAFPGNVSGRRSTRRRTTTAVRLPGLSPGASAVAIAQIRLTLRTPRGRSALLAPLLVFVVLTILSLRAGGTPLSIVPGSGIGLAVFGAFFSIMATLPFAMNQFALDGAGLTLELLSPLSDKELLDGKAVAIGALAGGPACLCLALAFLLFPDGPLALWISIPVGLAAICLLIGPVAAAVSATFPRAVDLNSIGHGSNPHGLAGLLGVASIVLSAVPVGLLTFISIRVLDRPELTLLLLVIWCAVTFAANRLLFRPVRVLLAKRRENLGMVV